VTLQFKNVASTPHLIYYHITKISPANQVPALYNCDNTYAHSYMWPHSWGAIPSAVISPVCSAFSSSFWAPHGSASPPSYALHKRNWPPQHSPSIKWSSQYHFHTVLHFPYKQHYFVTLSTWAHKNTFCAPVVSLTTFDTVRTRPGIKPEVQWRQNSTVWVPIE
jgi:hypothetical protein